MDIVRVRHGASFTALVPQFNLPSGSWIATASVLDPRTGLKVGDVDINLVTAPDETLPDLLICTASLVADADVTALWPCPEFEGLTRLLIAQWEVVDSQNPVRVHAGESVRIEIEWTV